MTDRIREKLQILADAAKYDVSCSSSGSDRKNKDKGLGNTGSGICHSYTEDGRCVSLLKILFSNVCIYDCAYCVSRRSNDVKRAAFTVQEVVDLTINFYRRNYIEGLFLSSGIFKSADYTMERMLQVVKKLRLEENFNGYIHLKTIPGASPELITEAGLYADRMSINLEMPTEAGLKQFAPEKSHAEVQKDLGIVRDRLIQFKDERKLIRSVPKFVPAGQTTQMVVGASNETDYDVMMMADQHYKDYKLKRVYYSGYIPINDQDKALPAIGSAPPLLRENRLYQSDWLMRFYGFAANEIVNPQFPNLDLEVDPKLSWALRHPEYFPVDINRADYQMILRIPGIGVRSAKKIIQARRFGPLRTDQLKKMGVAYSRAQHFMFCIDTPAYKKELHPTQVRQQILQSGQSKYTKQLSPQLGFALAMVIYQFDGTMTGLLCCIFRAFQFKEFDVTLALEHQAQDSLLAETIEIASHEAQAKRVWEGLSQKLSNEGLKRFYYSYLSEQLPAYQHLFNFAVYVFQSHISIEKNYGNPDVLGVAQWTKQVGREKHRMEAFVRFKKTKEGLFISLVRPDFNVLPLIQRHFKARYQDQEWLIYDEKRHYGIYYDLNTIHQVELNASTIDKNIDNGFSQNFDLELDEQEMLYDQLWKDYFNSVNIQARKNIKLHIQYVPKRYWRYMNEKII